METNNHRFPQALALLTVVETGSFTRAAERLGVSKAQVSKQVSALEAGLGVNAGHDTLDIAVNHGFGGVMGDGSNGGGSDCGGNCGNGSNGNGGRNGSDCYGQDAWGHFHTDV